MLAVHEPAHLAHLFWDFAPAVTEGAVSDMAPGATMRVAVALAGEAYFHGKKTHLAMR